MIADRNNQTTINELHTKKANSDKSDILYKFRNYKI